MDGSMDRVGVRSFCRLKVILGRCILLYSTVAKPFSRGGVSTTSYIIVWGLRGTDGTETLRERERHTPSLSFSPSLSHFSLSLTHPNMKDATLPHCTKFSPSARLSQPRQGILKEELSLQRREWKEKEKKKRN